jgi:phytoene dehydrogenase-like protein
MQQDNAEKNNHSNQLGPNYYDTIIIGSGVGSLSSAICLARAGQKVLVLEQHDVPGGWCHSFYLNGHRFTPGVHYIGLLEKGQSTNELYTGLGIANDIAFYKMNSKAFEHCWIGNERFDYPSDYNDFINALVKRFPEEEKNIRAYLKIVKNVGDQLKLIPKVRGFWQQITIPFRTKHMGKYAPFTLKRVMNWYIKNPLLKQFLGIQFGDHGLPPSKASFIMHAAIMDHYSSGGFYPMGGGGALVKAMTNKIKAHNGTVKTSASVKRILLDHSKRKKKAIGVELASGEQLFANRIISNADPGITYLNLVGKENISNKLHKRLKNTAYSCTSIMLFLTVDMDVKAAGLDSGNIWYMQNKDLDDVYNDMQRKDILSGDEFSGLFISCTTLKDPISFDGKHHTLEAITYINYDAFSDFKDEDRERSSAYLKFKEQLIEKFLNTLEKVVPGIRAHIVHKDLGTPITNEYYINSTKGNVYGTEKSLRYIGPFAYKAKSEIENLYMCGASIVSHGVAGAGYSGVQTAASILGCRQDDLIKPDDTQHIKIYDAEDATDYPDWMLKKMAVKKKRQELKEKSTLQ